MRDTQPISATLDHELRQAWARISIVAGNVRGQGFESASASADKRLPVSDSGRAQGDLEPFKLRDRLNRVKTERQARHLLDDMLEYLSEVTESKAVGRLDLGSSEGRYRAGKEAHETSVARVARRYDKPQSTVYRWRDEYLKAK